MIILQAMELVRKQQTWLSSSRWMRQLYSKSSVEVPWKGKPKQQNLKETTSYSKRRSKRNVSFVRTWKQSWWPKSSSTTTLPFRWKIWKIGTWSSMRTICALRSRALDSGTQVSSVRIQTGKTMPTFRRCSILKESCEKKWKKRSFSRSKLSIRWNNTWS